MRGLANNSVVPGKFNADALHYVNSVLPRTDEFGDFMNDDKYGTRSCPSCYREIPTFWDSCQFCGNIFRKPEPATDEPAMLFWRSTKKSK